MAEQQGRSVITTYVLDDNDRVRALLVDLISDAEGLVVVGASGSADVALSDIVQLRPQVVVVDGRMPNSDGLRVCQALRTVAPEVACVVVATGIETWGAPEAAAAGAAAYVLKQPKDFPLAEVVRKVAEAARPLDELIDPL